MRFSEFAQPAASLRLDAMLLSTAVALLTGSHIAKALVTVMERLLDMHFVGAIRTFSAHDVPTST